MNDTITITLPAFLELTLGTEKTGVRALPDIDTALIAAHKFNSGTLYKVQFNDFDGTPLQYPKLWDYTAWYNSSTLWKANKARSDRERVEEWIFRANVKILSKHIVTELLFDDDAAIALAYSLLKAKKFCNIRAINPLKQPKLVTKESELQ